MDFCINIENNLSGSLSKAKLPNHIKLPINYLCGDRCPERVDLVPSSRISDPISVYEAATARYPNTTFTFCLKDHNDPLLKALQEKNIPYFFQTHIKDWDTFLGYLKLHPTEVYLTEDMGFQLAAAAPIAHAAGVKIRVYPNVAQSAWPDTPALKKFFIRPEDVPYYEPYVDTMEFFGKLESQLTYYEIYAIKKKWLGKLNEIILDFNSDLDNKGLLPSFAAARTKCSKKCLRGSTCRICEAYDKLSDTLVLNNLVVRLAPNHSID